MRRTQGGHRNQFSLLPASDTLADADPPLSWYPRRVTLVLRVARDATGSDLTARQYGQASDAGTELGTHIGPIADRVRQRPTEARSARAGLIGEARRGGDRSQVAPPGSGSSA